MKNTVIFVLVTIVLAAAQVASAGLWDSIKKVGSDIADTAGNVASATVSFTTSTVHSVKQRTVFADPRTNTTETAQSNPAPVEVPTATQTVSTAETSAPAPTPAVQPSASAPVSVPSSVPVSVPQAAERKTATAADDGDNLFSRKKHRKEKRHQQHAEGKPSAKSDHSSSNDKKSENSALSAYQKFINDEFKPKIKACERALSRRASAFRSTYWFKGVYSYNELGKYESGQSELALKRLRELANGDDAEFQKLRSEASAWSFAGESLMQPWNYWSIKRRNPYFSEGNGRFNIYLSDNPDASLRYLDETNMEIGSLDNLSKWIERARAWLTREVEIVDKECSISALSVKRIAELHGRADYKPFAVYKDIVFGDSVIDVFEKMKKIDDNAHWMRMSRNDNDAGKSIETYLHGKQLYAEILSRHGLDFIFGSFAPNEGSVLVSMEMKFGTAPSADALVDKYKVEGAKVEKIRDIIDRKWPETEIGQFGLMLFNALEQKAIAIEEKKGDASTYRKDMLAVSEKYCQGTAVDKTVVSIDGVTISICENVETHKVIKVIFEDTLLSAKLKELCVKQKESDEKAAAEAKAAMEKKAKAAAVDF